jgi:DNA-binding beta-propeller fold protein YncE
MGARKMRVKTPALMIAMFAMFAMLAFAGVARAADSAYVANQVESTVSQYDIGAGGPLTAKAPPTVPTGANGSDPFGVVVSPDRASVYVINHGADSIAQYDIGADGGLSPKAPATVADTGSNPNGIAISLDGSSVYVANGSGVVSQYDVGAGGKLSPKATPTVAEGNTPFAITVSTNGASVYVTNASTNGAGGVSEYDVGAGGALTPKDTQTVAAGSSPSGIAVSPDGTSVYVANRSGGVSQYNVGGSGALTPKATPIVNAATGAYGIAVSPDGLSVYATNIGSNGAGGLSEYDVGAGGTLTLKASHTVDTGDGPSSVALTPDGTSAYVTNSFVTGAGGVSQYDVGAGGALAPKATPTASTGGEPIAIAIASGPPPGSPSASILTPIDGATYTAGAVVSASYSCSPGANGGALKPGSAGCSGPVPNGSQIDTSTVGAHTFAVTATDTDGRTATTTSHYTVAAGGGGGGGTPPPQSRPVNTSPPAIVDVPGSPHTYSCSPGTWVGAQGTIDPSGNAFPFTYTWQRLTPDSSFFGGYRIDTVATGQVYRPTAGSAFALAQSWLIRCLVQTSNGAGSASAVSAPRTLSPAPPLKLVNNTTDVRVTGIEATQAIQQDTCSTCGLGTLPTRSQADETSPGSANYQGVTLAAGKFTVVRVFATFTQPANQSSLPGATATLRVYDSDGHQIATLNPDSSPASLGRTPMWVSAAERATPGVSFNFLVPWQDTLHKALSFRATVNPPVGLAGLAQLAQCASCKANTFDLIGVPFVPTAVVPVHPIPLTIAGVQTSHTEQEVFGSAQAVLPVKVQIFPYDAPLPVDGMSSEDATYAVNERGADDGLVGSDYPIGVFIDGVPNLGGLTLGGRKLYDQTGPVSIVRADRPLTSAMHEIGHGLGLSHADTTPHPDGTVDCGGNSNGQIGEEWPPDNEGRIQGIGLDWRKWTIGKTGSLPSTVVEGYDPVGNPLQANYFYYDFMSYCPFVPGGQTVSQFEAEHWISVRNWNRLVAFHPPAQALPAAASRNARAAGATPLRVIATVDSAGKTSIFEVEPGEVTPARATVASPYRVELRDAAGTALTSAMPTVSPIHIDGQRPGLLLEATLPFAASTAAVVLSADGIELARRTRSPHAPTVKLLAPRSRSRLSGRAATLVRWSAHDADSDPLTATVDYSADGGRHWKVVADRVRASSARVPGRLLSASHNGRLRVRVSDGFDAATAISGRLRAAGTPPIVRITRSGRGGRVRADTMLLLQGAAFDDADRPLTGRHLRWYAGKRLIGRGELLTVMRLSRDDKLIRLVATDSHGRSSQAELRLNVVAVPPAFLVARAPTHIKASAKRVRIVVASTVPSVLTIAGSRHRVGRKPDAITIAIKRGHRTLRLKYSLRAIGGGTIRGVYVATR